MSAWKKTKVSQFLFERQGKYKPNASEVVGLKRIDKIDFQGNFHIANKPSKTNMILVKNGDLVISGINVSKGALGIYEGAEPVTATIHYSSYTFDENQIHIEYLKRFLKSPKFIELLKGQVRGGIKTEIKPKHVLALEILLPHIDEQGEIVEKFRRIETEDSELKAEISYQRVLLKKLRQQILQDAVEGKLTADWREENPDTEPASALLKKITAEKEQLFKEKKIKKQKPYSDITEKEKLFSLPKGWEWCRFGNLILSYEAGKSFKCIDRPVSNDEWGVIKTSAITSSDFLENENKFYQTNALPDVSKKVNVGDLIFCRASGSKGLAGKCAIVKQISKNLLLSDKTPRLFTSDKISKQFIFLHNESQSSNDYYLGLNTGKSTSMNNITKDQLFCKPFPLPPLEEQQAIVSKVEALFAICDQLEAKITQNQEHANQLMQAVLKEAFNHSEDKVQATNNVIELKPAKNNKQADYYKRTLLAAEIVDQLHKEPTFGHLKLQKMIFLCQKIQDIELPTNFLQQAAGPYDPQMARSLDKQLKEKQWYDYNGNATLKYRPLDAAGAHKEDYLKYFQNELDGIKHLITLFKTKKSNEMEAVATLYACWEEILNSESSFSKEVLIEKFFAWSEEKRKFSECQLNQVITWMEKYGIYPHTKNAG